MSGKITITNVGEGTAVIDVEGVIGVPEVWQFEDPGQRVATYETFRSVLASIREVRSPDVVVNIRSTGGNVEDALLIYEALVTLGAKITTRCYGYIASAATIIAQAASAGRREISANSLYLIHKSICAAEGNAEEITQTLDMLDKTDQRLADIYAVRSGKNAEKFIRLMAENNGKGRWLSPAETLEYGLADRIIPSTPIGNDAAESVSKLGLPPLPAQLLDLQESRWNRLLKKLGFSEPVTTISPVAGEPVANVSVPKKMTGATVAASGANAEAKSQDTPRDREMEELRSRITRLEKTNARLLAGPTATLFKDDPSVRELKRGANEEAYREDANKFKN